MNFRKWLENVYVQTDIETSDFGDRKNHYLIINNKNHGEISFGHVSSRSMETINAKNMFPNIYKSGQTIARIQGVEIDDEARGKGYGQLLYLGGMINHGAEWYYNSQVDAPATNVLKSLAKKGWAEVYWHREREPDWDQDGGVHLVRITPAGKQAYQRLSGKEKVT